MIPRIKIDTLAASASIWLLLGNLQALPSPDNTLPKSAAPTKNLTETIIIRRFKIVNNNVIASSQIQSVLQPYLFRPISFLELLEVQRVITELYVNRGYITTGAYIPPQTIVDRTVKIEIVEGKLDEIEIAGLKKLRPEYIRARVAIAAQPPLNQDRLLNALQLLQLDPLIKNISAELSQGINPGESFLKLKIEEADSFALKLDLNNRSSTSIGSLGTKITLGENNLTGFGDFLGASYIKTNGSESLSRLQYQVPLGARGSEISLNYSRNDSEIIIEPFQDLDLDSNNRSYQATFIQSLLQKPTQDIYFGFSFTHQNTRLSLKNRAFPELSRGSDEDGKTIISSLRFILEYNDRGQDRIFSARSQIALGIDAFNSTINNNELPDSKFLIWRGQLQYLKAISSQTKILLRGEIQVADRPLFPQEQFNISGLESVRGYNEGRVTGDNGVFLSAEIQNTILHVPKWNLNLEIGSFADFGRIWNTDNFPLESNNTLAALGILAQIAIADNFTARVDWGLPLIDDKLPQGDSLQDRGVYFSLNFKPF